MAFGLNPASLLACDGTANVYLGKERRKDHPRFCPQMLLDEDSKSVDGNCSSIACQANKTDTQDTSPELLPPSDLVREAKVVSLTGDELLLTDLWQDRRAVVAWARHFGCLLCRKRASLLAASKAEMDAAGVALVIIGPGNVEQARGFAEQTNFPGEVYADPTFETFRAFGFIFGAETVFTPKAALNLVSARMEGFKQDWNLSLQRDTVLKGGWQQGGVLVAGPGTSNLLFLHKDKEAGDEPSMKELLAACRL